MNEITPEPAPVASPARDLLLLEPLRAESLSPAVQKLLAGTAPAKAMAAKGLAPLRPVELVLVAYQLSFDADETLKAAGLAAPGALPDRILTSALAEPLPPVVIHFFAQRIDPSRSEIIEKILYNKATANDTFVSLASRVKERETEIIFQNEERFLKCPAILEALFANREARMSSLNRALELAARHGLRPEGISGFDEIVKSIADDPGAKDAAADATFGAVLAATDALGPDALALLDEPEQPAAGPEGPKKRKSMVIDFGRLKMHEKVRLATLGNAYCRSNLLRDPNRIVAMAAIRSPRVTDGDIISAAANRMVSEDVLRYISNQREYMKMYAVKMNLIKNPKCPMGISLRLLPYVNPEDVKELAKSKNVPTALQTAAKRLMMARQSKSNG